MPSYQNPVEVISDLGDKVVEALVKSVSLAAQDLTKYRTENPVWVADHSERGLANWIHDRLWAHLVALLHGLEDIAMVDEEPVRDVWVRNRYRLRIKRHHDDGSVSTYPTASALEFYVQGPVQLALQGLDEVRLTSGYDWEKESREIGVAVLVLRDGLDNIIWREVLSTPESGAQGGATPLPPVPGPRPPRLGGLAGQETIRDAEDGPA